MVNIGVVGATGQVGQVMRTLLEERDFPATVGAVLRLRAVAGQEAAVPRAGDRGRGRRDRGPDRPGHRAVLRGRDDVARAGAAVRRGGRRSSSTTRRRGARTPTCRWWSARSTSTEMRNGLGSRRASSPTRTAPRWPRCRCSRCCTTRRGLVRIDRVDLSGGVGQRAGRRAGTLRAGPRGGRRQRAAGARRRRAGVPAAQQVRRADRVQRGAAWQARSSTTTPARPTRTRSCATKAARSSAFRTCW